VGFGGWTRRVNFAVTWKKRSVTKKYYLPIKRVFSHRDELNDKKGTTKQWGLNLSGEGSKGEEPLVQLNSSHDKEGAWIEREELIERHSRGGKTES